MKYTVLLAALLLLTIVLPFESWGINEPFTQPTYSSSPPPPATGDGGGPNYVPPSVGGNANREIIPIGNGCWILTGLAMVYGIARRQRKDKRIN
jgi:hypothetical protein